MKGRNRCWLPSHSGSVGWRDKVGNFYANNKIFANTVGVLGLVFSILYAGYTELLRISKDRHETLVGLLTGSKDSFHFPIFVVGGVAIDVKGPDGVIFRDENGDSLLKMTIDGKGRLLTSAKVSDLRGNLIVNITDNEWQHQSRPAIWDRNYNDHVLEVLDSHGDVALQVVDLGDAVSVKGVFACASGSIMMLNSGYTGRMEMVFNPQISPGLDKIQKIVPVCKYPSDLHLGECPGFEGVANDAALRHVSSYPMSESVNLCPAPNAHPNTPPR